MGTWREERGWVFDLQRFDIAAIAKAVLLSSTALPSDGTSAYYTIDGEGAITQITDYTSIVGDQAAEYAVTAGNYLKISLGSNTYTVTAYTVGADVKAASQDEAGFIAVLTDERKATLTALTLGESNSALALGGKSIVSTGSTIDGYISIATSGDTATLNDKKYKAAAANTALTIGATDTLTSGALTLDRAGSASVASVVTSAGTVTAAEESVNVTNAGVVSDLAAGDKFTIASGDPLVTTTYTVYDNYVVGKSNEDTPTVSSYKLASGAINDATFAVAGTQTLEKLTAKQIAITAGSKSDVGYMADGLEVPADYNEAVATFTAATDNPAADAKFEATGKISSGVSISGLAVDVEDAKTGTQYTLGTSGPVVTSTDKFSVDASSNITDTGEKLNVVSGELVSKDVDGKFDLVASSGDGTPTVKFAQGTAPNNAQVTVTGEKTITLTETTNATDTVVSKDGSVTGLDAAGVVAGVPADKEVTTTEEKGLFTVNGKKYDAANASGLTITAVDDNTSKLTSGTVTLTGDDANKKSFMDADGNTIALAVTGTEKTVEVKADGTLNTALADGQTVTTTGTQKNSFAVVGSYVTVTIGDADAVTYLADDLADTKNIDVDAASFTKPDGWNSVEFAEASGTDVTLSGPTSADMKIFASAANTSGTVYFKVTKTADKAYTLAETSDASGFTGTLDVTAFSGSTLTVKKANLTGKLKISDATSISALTASGDTFTIGTDGKVTGVTALTLTGTKLDVGTEATVTVGSEATYTINGKEIVVATVGTNKTVQIKTDATTVTEVVLDDANDKITGFDGTYKINGATITLSEDKAVDVSYDGTYLVVENLDSGASIKVGDNSFISTGTSLTITTDGELVEGTVTVKDTLVLSNEKNGVKVSGAKDGVTVEVSGGKATSIKDLEPTEIVSYYNETDKAVSTYQAVSDTTLSIKVGSTTNLYDVSSMIAPSATIESLDVVKDDFSGLDPVKVETGGTWATTPGSYTMAGTQATLSTHVVAFTVVNASKENSNPTVTVTSAVTAGVFDLTETNTKAALSSVTFKDSNTGTVYKLSETSSVKLNGTLTSSKDGVLTSGSGTVTAASGTITTKTAAPAFDVSQGSTSVLFSSGTSLSSTAVTTEKGTIKITESSNTTDTTVASDGKVSGIDGNATITGAVTDQTITTTGDGTVSINGTSWTVAGSTNGVTYTADANTKGKVSSIKDSAGNDLAKGTTISTTNDISGSTINNIKVNSATKGLSMTQTDTGASVTLSNSGDEIVSNDKTFKVNAAGNGVTVSPEGTVSGLTDGEKVTVTNGTTETVYEVTGNTLVTTQTNNTDPAKPVTKTYTSILADGETDGFTVELNGTTATNAAKEADKTADTTGFTLGGATPVNEVTTGMMVDASGNATTSSQKAVAEVTILNDGDEIKYTSKQDKKQTVNVGAGNAANKEWDITTGGGSDAITFAGAKDATINAGNGNNTVTLTNTGDVSVAAGSGNDTIDIKGTGDALVSVAGGRNVITHTGTGTASIAGGTGNDTISSSNENDLIYGGAGNNTFKTTAGKTNKISDFTFGADKAALAGVTGALDASQVVVGTDGTIAYGDKATSGALDVSAEGFDGFYAVSIADQDGKHKLNVGWTGENGGKINASGLTEKALLIGNSEGRADTLMGGSAGDTLKAGTGDSSLWGGAGNDTLVSSTEASTSFFFLAGDGQDQVQGFKAYTEDTKDTADTLDFYGQGISSVMLTDSGIKVTKGTDSMTLVGSYDANTMIQWKNGDAKGVAKVGKNAETNSFTYDSAVTNYLGGTKTDTVAVSDDGMGVNVWMDGSQGVGYASIEVLDASSVTGKATLAGGAGSNTITGGQGESSLWGGADGSDDVLNAGSGTNTFFYGLGNGNDVVNGTKEGDTVNLFNLNLSDLTSAVIEDSKITVTQANGQTLTVNGQANTFTLADGSTWQADHSTKTWRQNS